MYYAIAADLPDDCCQDSPSFVSIASVFAMPRNGYAKLLILQGLMTGKRAGVFGTGESDAGDGWWGASEARLLIAALVAGLGAKVKPAMLRAGRSNSGVCE
jgi:hypothetical protein